NSITQYFILFGCIGLNLYGQREIAYYQKDIEKRSKVFFELLLLRIITVLISIVLYYFTFCQNATYGYIFSIQIIDVIASMFDISWLYQGMEDFKKIVVRNTLVKICGLIIIFMFVKSPADLPIYVLSYSATLLLGNLSMWMYLPKFVKKVSLKHLNIQKHLRPTIVLFLPQIATSIYTMLDKTMIGALTGNTAEVGYYEQSQKLIKMAMTLATSLGTVMLPRVANLFKEGKIEEVKESMYSSFRFISFLTFPICLGLIGITKGFVPWFFGAGYDKVVLNMIMIAPIIIIIGYSNVIGTQFLLPTGRQKQYTISVCAGTVVNLVFNLILIPHFLSYGAAIATVVAEMSVTFIQILFTRNIFSYKYILKLIYKYIIASAIMLIILLIVGNIFSSSIISTVIEIGIGAIVYLIILLVLKDETVKNVISKRKKEG
uniref:oligosaccharide flippase family protein n=1 Tax=Faecalibacillus faecis TaxID=1982628 RepID=UPI003870B27E